MTTEIKSNKTTVLEEIKSLGFIVLIAILIRTFIVEPFFIPSGSMKDTLLPGDYIFSTKYSYGYSKYSMLFVHPNFWHGRVLTQMPERGDIVIFRPPHRMDMRYIKRLIGMPGDKVQLINDVVYINNVPLEHKYIETFTDNKGVSYKRYLEKLPNGLEYYVLNLVNQKSTFGLSLRYNNTEVFYVPEGQYFFLGDNRDESGDSRVDLGFVPFENFIAKAQFIFFSTGELLWLDSSTFMEQIKQVYHWITSIRFNRLFHIVYNLGNTGAN